MPESPNGWIQLAAILFGGGLAAAIVQAIALRRKVGTDSDAVFVATANEQRKSLVDDNDRLRAARDAESRRADRLERKLRQWWARADAVMAWARRQQSRNAEAGIDDPMPPLYPPDD